MKDIYSRMIDVIQHRLAATGIPQHKAISAGIAAADVLRAEMGGATVYFPRRNPFISRDCAIRREYNGRNMDDVCRRFRVSRATVYRTLQEK